MKPETPGPLYRDRHRPRRTDPGERLRAEPHAPEPAVRGRPGASGLSEENAMKEPRFRLQCDFSISEVLEGAFKVTVARQG